MTISRRLAVGASVTALAMGLAACGSDDGGSNEGSNGSQGEGLPADSTKEEWVASFESVDPVEIRTQSAAPMGSPSGKDWEDFMGRITEYSGGKITFDVGFSNAYAPADEANTALIDGRLDMAQVIPQYAAQELPTANAIVGLGVLSDQSVVTGTVTSNLWPLEAAFNSGVLEEYDQAGMKALIPYYNTGAGSLFCQDPHTSLAQLNGSVVAASGAMQSEQLRALSVQPTSIVFTEFYESIQRGVVECAQTTATAGLQVGLGEIAPNIVIDDTAGFIPGAGTIAFSKDTWEDMPIEAQQLIWDSLPIFIAGNMEKVWGNYVLLAAEVDAAGGQITPFDEDARGVMVQTAQAISDQIAESAGADVVDAANEAKVKWDETTAEAGITNNTDYAGLEAWLAEGEHAVVTDFVHGHVYDTIFAPLRP